MFIYTIHTFCCCFSSKSIILLVSLIYSAFVFLFLFFCIEQHDIFFVYVFCIFLNIDYRCLLQIQTQSQMTQWKIGTLTVFLLHSKTCGRRWHLSVQMSIRSKESKKLDRFTICSIIIISKRSKCYLFCYFFYLLWNSVCRGHQKSKYQIICEFKINWIK